MGYPGSIDGGRSESAFELAQEVALSDFCEQIAGVNSNPLTTMSTKVPDSKLSHIEYFEIISAENFSLVTRTR